MQPLYFQLLSMTYTGRRRVFRVLLTAGIALATFADPASGQSAPSAGPTYRQIVNQWDSSRRLATFNNGVPDLTHSSPGSGYAVVQVNDEIFGIHSNGLYRIGAKGEYTEVAEDPALSISTPRSITYDEKRRALIVSGDFFVYAYDPGVRRWSVIVADRTPGVERMSAYCKHNDRYYTVKSGMLLELLPTGQLISERAIDGPLRARETKLSTTTQEPVEQFVYSDGATVCVDRFLFHTAYRYRAKVVKPPKDYTATVFRIDLHTVNGEIVFEE